MTAPTSFPCLSSARVGVCLCPGFRCVLLEFGLLTLWDTLQFFVCVSLASGLAPVSFEDHYCRRFDLCYLCFLLHRQLWGCRCQSQHQLLSLPLTAVDSCSFDSSAFTCSGCNMGCLYYVGFAVWTGVRDTLSVCM